MAVGAATIHHISIVKALKTGTSPPFSIHLLFEDERCWTGLYLFFYLVWSLHLIIWRRHLYDRLRAASPRLAGRSTPSYILVRHDESNVETAFNRRLSNDWLITFIWLQLLTFTWLDFLFSLPMSYVILVTIVCMFPSCRDLFQLFFTNIDFDTNTNTTITIYHGLHCRNHHHHSFIHSFSSTLSSFIDTFVFRYANRCVKLFMFCISFYYADNSTNQSTDQAFETFCRLFWRRSLHFQCNHSHERVEHGLQYLQFLSHVTRFGNLVVSLTINRIGYIFQ